MIIELLVTEVEAGGGLSALVVQTSAPVTGISRCFDVILCFLLGVGGQVDFLRGAALGHDGLGKPILALNSVTKRGESKITPFLKEGT